MIKLSCGICRKIGEPNYGSRGASVNLEMDLESSSAIDSHLQDHIRSLFAVARGAVDEELRTDHASSEVPAPATPPPAANGGNNGARMATQAQLRAIKAICDRLKLDPDRQARERFNCTLAELTLPNASSLIGHLKGLPISVK
jgi:hypothetical protein